MKCDVSFTDITDLTEWQTKITANEIHFSGKLLGSKPKGSFEKKKVSSCTPEQVIAGSKQIDFNDYNADETNFGEYTFWNTILENQTLYKMGYVSCDGLFYGFVEDFTAEIDDEVEEDSKGNTFIGGSLYFDQLKMTVPQKIAGLSTVFG